MILTSKFIRGAKVILILGMLILNMYLLAAAFKESTRYRSNNRKLELTKIFLKAKMVDPDLFKHNVNTLNTLFTTSIFKSINLNAHTQTFKSLQRTHGSKNFVQVLNHLEFQGNYYKMLHLLDYLIAKNIAHRIETLDIDASKAPELKVKLKFNVLAYEKI